MAKKTFVVTHGSLYLAVGGKLQQVEKGYVDDSHSAEALSR